MPTLYDGDGFEWDFVNWHGTVIADGTSDAFDYGLQLSIDGTLFSGTFGPAELDGRQLLATGSIGGIAVERRLYVPDDSGDGWARLLESFTNTGSSAVTITVTVMSNSGNDWSMQVLDTSSGDTAFTTADHWIVNDDSSTGDGGYDPTVAHIFTDGTLAPTSVGTTVFDAAGNQGVTYTFTLTIQPGATVSILHYATQQSTRAGINSELPTLADPDDAALYGLTAAQLDSIVNFDVSTTVTLDFTEISGYPLWYGDQSWGYYATETYSENGFTFESNSGSISLWSPTDPNFYSSYGLSDSPSLSENYSDSTTTLTRDNGETFGLISTRGGLLAQQGGITFVATFEDGHTETFTYTTDSNLGELDNIVFPASFASGIVQVVITSDTNWWTFDDMVLSLSSTPADTTPPAAPTLDLDAVADSGVSDNDDLTNDSTPALSGTAEAGSTVTVYEGSTELGTATADGDGNWLLTLAAALSDGEHTLTATATDAAGNVSDVSAGLTVTIDTATPDPTIASTSPSSDTTPVLAGTAEAGASVEITDEDGNVVATVTADGDGNWSHELAELMDGDYDYWAVATDAAGNVSNSSSTTVSVVVIGDTVLGENGGGEILGTDGRDDLSGGNGTDTLDGGWAPDILRGNNGADTLLGGAGDDSLYGGNGPDVLDGGDGDDLLVGGRGDDLMTGGAGADLFVIGGSDGNDTIADFTVGEDSLQLDDGLSVSSLAYSGDDTLVYLSNGGLLTLLNANIASADLLLGA